MKVELVVIRRLVPGLIGGRLPTVDQVSGSHILRSTIRSVTGTTVRMASTYMVDDPAYSFLKELGLQSSNPGVFNGKWIGSGEVGTHYYNICVTS